MTGPTRSGKSYVARALLLSAQAPRLVIDPTDSSLMGSIPGQVTFRDPHRLPTDAATARFVPDDPEDLDAYDAVYRQVFEHFPRYVLLDEAGLVATASKTPRYLRRVIIQGAKRSIGHVACHTRPREVDKNLIAQAQHVLIFGCVDPEDRKHLAGQMGVGVPELEEALGELAPREFVWFRQAERRLVVCPALPG